MSLGERLDSWGRGFRGPLLAALLALAAGLPGLLALPPLDRDESRFAEASAQMLESGDFTTIQFQDQPRFKKPAGIYWLQAAAVAAVSHVEDRAIWAYRLPSLAGAMLAAAACAWGAAAFLEPGLALVAGGLLGASFILSTEVGIAATDGALTGAVTLTLAALGRIYLAARGGPPAGKATRFLMWTGIAGAVLLKGPIGPMVFLLTLASLALADRKVRWMGALAWGWGLIGLALATLPWALAITVATDGAFWGQAVGGDLAPKLMGRQEGHGAPFGLHLVLAPLLLFPATLLAPAGVMVAWRARAEPAVRFALCWLIPSWLVFEIAPTKLVHYTLPLYGALAWLMARALAEPLGPRVRVAGAALFGLVALIFAAVGPLAAIQLGYGPAGAWAAISVSLFLLSGALGGWIFWRGGSQSAVLAAVVAAGLIGTAAHGALAGGLVPALKPLWLSSQAARALSAAHANPRDGLAPGPVTVAGYAEPSLVFLLGADTELGTAADAAEALSEGRPAIVEGREAGAFQAALKAQGLTARQVGEARGLDYSKGRPDILRIYQAAPPVLAAPSGAVSDTTP